MQFLCQLDVQGDGAAGQLDEFLAAAEVSPATAEYAGRLARTAWDQHQQLDRCISRQLERWALDRLSPVERNVIRVALAELPGGQVPPKVVINEAIEIGREYGGGDSPSTPDRSPDTPFQSTPPAGGATGILTMT